MNSRAEVIFSGTFVNSLGVIAGTSQARQLSIGLDRDEFDVAPNSVLTSVVKRTDIAVREALSGYANGWPVHRDFAGSLPGSRRTGAV